MSEERTPEELLQEKKAEFSIRPEDFIDKKDLIIAVDTDQRLFIAQVASTALKLAWATINSSVFETLMMMRAKAQAKKQVDKRIITPGNN